jgi:Fe-S cluster biogenesis protein NfuA
MPSWFSKVFKTEETSKAVTGPQTSAAVIDDDADDDEPMPKARRVVHAPVTFGDDGPAGSFEEIAIKARRETNVPACVLMVNRPLLQGLSFWAPEAHVAYAYSPLAAALFDVGGVASVLIHDTTVTVMRDGSDFSPWEDFAKRMGEQIRAHLKSGIPVLDPSYQESIPGEEEIRERLQRVIDEEINPGIASHSGVIVLNRVVGNTIYITMGGGCQGCAASSITLRSGVEGAFRKEVPQLGAVLDETDHTSGVNPFFREMPAGMGM